MIDTKELRRLVRVATPGPWKVGQYLGSPRQFVIHMDVGDKGRGSDVAFTSTAFGNDETVANARLIAAAHPAAISELLDRLETAERERDALRAKIEAMEKQEPVAFVLNAPKLKRCAALLDAGKKLPHKTKLYVLPGAQAQPAPSVPEQWKLVPIEPDEMWAYRVIRHHQPNLEVGCGAWLECLETMLHWHAAMLTAAPEAKT